MSSREQHYTTPDLVAHPELLQEAMARAQICLKRYESEVFEPLDWLFRIATATHEQYIPQTPASSPIGGPRAPDSIRRLVLGTSSTVEDVVTARHVAYIKPYNDKRYDGIAGRTATLPGIEVDYYMLEEAAGNSNYYERVSFSPDPKVVQDSFGSVRLRRHVATCFSDESARVREDFVDGQVSKVNELLQTARNPELNPLIAAEITRHNLAVES